MATYSFQSAKLVSGGEGGAVTFVEDGHLAEDAFRIHNCGRADGAPGYDHRLRCSNFRLPEFSAAVLRSQLRRADQLAEVRERNAVRLEAATYSIPGVKLQGRDPRCTRHGRYMVLLEVEANRDRFVDALQAEGIPATRAYPSVFDTDSYWAGPASPGRGGRTWRQRCPVADHFAQQGIWLHHRLLLGTERDTDDVARAVEKVAKNLSTQPSYTARKARFGTSRVGILGLGWAASELWRPRLLAHPAYEIAAVHDSDPTVERTFLEAVPSVCDAPPDRWIEEGIDLVLVLTPNSRHVDAALPFIQQGLDVLIEKPVCRDLHEFARLERAASASGSAVVPSRVTHYRDDVLALRSELAELGEIESVNLSWQRANGVPTPGSWYTCRQCGGGVLNDLGPHLLDLGLGLVGPHEIVGGSGVQARAVLAVGEAAASGWHQAAGSNRHPIDADVTASGFLALDGGRWLGFRVSWRTPIDIDTVLVDVQTSHGFVSLRTTFGFSPNRITQPTLTVVRVGALPERRVLPPPELGAEYDRQLDHLAVLREADPSNLTTNLLRIGSVAQALELTRLPDTRPLGPGCPHADG